MSLARSALPGVQSALSLWEYYCLVRKLGSRCAQKTRVARVVAKHEAVGTDRLASRSIHRTCRRGTKAFFALAVLPSARPSRVVHLRLPSEQGR